MQRFKNILEAIVIFGLIILLTTGFFGIALTAILFILTYNIPYILIGIFLLWILCFMALAILEEHEED